jgi:YVTN family beta-propeller protein
MARAGSFAVVSLLLAACSSPGARGSAAGGAPGRGGAATRGGTSVSSSLQITKDDATLWIVDQDSDAVSVIDTGTGALVDEIPLAAAPPAVDPATGRFEPAVLPRALALVGDAKVYVAGESANAVYVIDAATHAVAATIPVPAAPVAVAAAPDGSAVYVVSHEAAVLSRIDPATDRVTASLPLTQHPWGLAVSDDGASVFVTHLLLDPGVSVVDASTFTLKYKTALADQPPGSDVQIPNGVARELFAVAPSPAGGELWVLHSLLATKTAQCPDGQACSQALVFDTTAFPTISTLSPDGATPARRLLFQPPVAGAAGSFTDSCSGPRAVAFTPDGALALVADAQSEDVMVFDATTGREVSLVRPVPSALLEGIVVDHAGKHAYVDGRNTHDVTVLDIDPTSALAPVTARSTPIARTTADPMPAAMRHGQRLFNSANSSAFPITQNFWIACATCHPEGGSDAVTWLFSEGPRDTPSNAGGPINTGFLLRQALRAEVQQYDEVIDSEQGGSYHLTNAMQKPDLDDLARYVNYAIPFPQNPNLAPGGALTASQARGRQTFAQRCASCHSGPYLTDSGAGNPTLDLRGPIVLHDIGTCVTTGAHPDRPGYSYVADPAGQPDRKPCEFDTPTLRGIFATPPYFHDGSAPTLMDVVNRLPFSSDLAPADKADLVAYLLTL